MNTSDVQCEENSAASKAIKRYRRIRTIGNKAVDTADICGLQINILIYDPKLHRFKEIYTSKNVRLDSIQELTKDKLNTTKTRKKYRALKF